MYLKTILFSLTTLFLTSCTSLQTLQFYTSDKTPDRNSTFVVYSNPKTSGIFTNITVCVKKHCQKIKNVLVDTGSVGVRIFRKAFNKNMQKILENNAIKYDQQNIHSEALYAPGTLNGDMVFSRISTGTFTTKTNLLVAKENTKMAFFLKKKKINGIFGIMIKNRWLPDYTTKTGEKLPLVARVIVATHENPMRKIKSYKIKLDKKGSGTIALSTIYSTRKINSKNHIKYKAYLDTGSPYKVFVLDGLTVFGLPTLYGNEAIYTKNRIFIKKLFTS